MTHANWMTLKIKEIKYLEMSTFEVSTSNYWNSISNEWKHADFNKKKEKLSTLIYEKMQGHSMILH